jgi:transposase
MATFGGLFDFPDLSDSQSELSSPPDSSDSDESEYTKATKDKENTWYNLLSDSEDKDDDSIASSFTLPLRPLVATSTAFIIPDIVRKEYVTSARIKAIYMLEQRRSAGDIKKATRVSQTRIYELASLARQRGWKENEDMPLEVCHVLNQPRSGRPAISSNAIKCVLQVVLQNSTIYSFSCATIAKEIRKRGHEVAIRTVWKVLTAAGYSQYKLIVKPGLNKLSKKQRLDWYLEHEHWSLED